MKSLTLPLSDVQQRIGSRTLFSLLDVGIILGFSILPLLVNLPYRVNIFLSWEGAYRLYLGQMPFRDFGMPLGYGYFLLPAMFFKLFGPYLFSLVYGQAFLNILTLFSFRSILRLLGVRPFYATLAVLVFCLSFTFAINFWPWYNNSAYVYGMFALNFVLLAIFRYPKAATYWLAAAGALTALSLFTKQDFGGLWFASLSALLLLDAWYEKKFKRLITYVVSFALVLALMIVPLLPYDFLYWFNYGQAPHDSRLHVYNFLQEALGGSAWEKIYLFLIGLAILLKGKNLRAWLADKQQLFLYVVCTGMVLAALITKVTSRLPLDTSTYFHGFAVALLLQVFARERLQVRPITVIGMLGLVMLWWSGVYWRYAEKVFQIQAPEATTALADEENAEPIKWALSDYKAFEGIYLPEETIAGMKRIEELPVVRSGKELQVLNMSELTPLAHELGYTPMVNQPLWYHLNIGMFDEQVAEFQQKVAGETYDLVLFEDIPSLTEFYPYAVRESLQEHYQQVDRFLAPRVLGDSYIEVYVRKP